MSKPQMSTLPLRLDDQPGEDVDQRRLARAVGAEQPENLAARDVEADIVQRELAAGIGLGQRFDADGGLVHGAARHRSGANQRQAFKVNAPFTLIVTVIFKLTEYLPRRHDRPHSSPAELLALLLLLLSAAAGAAPVPATQNAQGTVSVLRPLTILKHNGHGFRRAGGDGRGDRGARSRQRRADHHRRLVTHGGPAAHPAVFTSTGSRTANVHIRIPQNPITLTRVGGTETMIVSTWTLDGHQNRKYRRRTAPSTSRSARP